MRLNEKVALITGGANGIGLATTERFAKEGAKIILWDVSEKGNDVTEGLKKKGTEAIFKKVSVSNQDEVQKAVAEAKKHFGRIDILINNAGITRDRTLLKMSKQELITMIENAGFEAVERDTVYNRVVKATKPAR